MRSVLLIIAICLFLIGPAAKIYQWNNADKYLLVSGLGLVIITAMAFIKKD
jgi:fucose permease